MGTINYDMVTRISNQRKWPVERIDNPDGSTTYKCGNCGAVICHDEPGSIRLGILPHVEGEEDNMEACVCVAREKP